MTGDDAQSVGGTERVPDCSHKSGHKWETVRADIEGRGSGSTYTVMQCSLCRNLLIDHEPEVIAEVGRDA